VGGVDAYLASLDMTITFQPFDAMGRARIVQLINKSNQYNLTTRRYTDPEVTEAENDPEVFTLQVRLADIFGDNGMISVVICRPGEPGCVGDRHLADELPRAGPQGGAHGAARNS
jgi:predicted enzyme involved in methoxymalonyl-ACP biosynthesis